MAPRSPWAQARSCLWSRSFRGASRGYSGATQYRCLAAIRAGIVFRRLLPEELERLPNARVAKLDLRNDDRVQLVRDPRRARCVLCECIRDRPDDVAIFSYRLFPAFFDLPELARSGLVECFLAVM